MQNILQKANVIVFDVVIESKVKFYHLIESKVIILIIVLTTFNYTLLIFQLGT